MVSWLLFVYVSILLHVQSKSYRDHRRYHHVQSAKRGIDDRLRHTEEMDLFGFDFDEIAPTDPLNFGSNNLKIGVAPNPEQQSEYKKNGRKLMGDTLTAVFVYGRMVYHTELLTNEVEKEALESLYKAWKGVKPRLKGVAVARWGGKDHDLMDMWDKEKKFIDSEYTKSVWHVSATKTKWTHGISAGTLRAVSVYTNDHHNVGGKILRRLFYDYGVWSKLMTPAMLENFQNFGAKLYQATHSFRMSNVLKYIHDYVKKHEDEYRVDDENLYLYHGASIGALTTINQDWNLDRKKVWWGPTSATIKVDVASDTDYGRKGVVYEIRIPMDTSQWPAYADFGLMAALMISAKTKEQEVLCWNIPTAWMTPIKTQGKWFVKKYGTIGTAFNLVKKTAWTFPTAVNKIQELYDIQDQIKAGW